MSPLAARSLAVNERFATPDPILVDLRIPAGNVDVEAAETAETAVTVEALNDPARDRLDEVVVSLDGSRLRIEAPESRVWIGRTPEYAVTVTCPLRSRVRLRSASTDLTVRGTIGGAEVKTASGDVTLADVDGDVRVESASADVRVASVSGQTSLQSASGDVQIGTATGPVKSQSASGDVLVGDSHDRLQVQTVSGDLRVERIVSGSLEISAVSGDVDLAVAPGAAVWLDLRSLSGDTRSELDAGDAPAEGEALIEIRGKTVSGDVRIRRAGV